MKFSQQFFPANTFHVSNLSRRVSVIPLTSNHVSKVFSILNGIPAQDQIFQRDKDPFLQKPDAVFFSDTHSNLSLFKYLLQPEISKGKKNKRVRHSPTEFKCLNALYQLNKNVISGKWSIIACGKKRIGTTASVSRKAVTKFINGEGAIFFKKKRRFKATNFYEMRPWVIEAFEFFEKKGMMHGILEDYEKWRKRFLKRLENWLLPLLEKGLTLQQILMNKLTKSRLKGAYLPPLKGAGIKPTEYKTQGILNRDLELLQLPCFSDAEFLGTQLKNRFFLREGDINSVMNSFNLREMKGGVRIYGQWVENGFKPQSPVAGFIAAVKQARKEKATR